MLFLVLVFGIAFGLLWKRLRDVSAHQAELLIEQGTLRAAVERLERKLRALDRGTEVPVTGPAAAPASAAAPAESLTELPLAPPPRPRGVPLAGAPASGEPQSSRPISAAAPRANTVPDWSVAASSRIVEFFTSGNLVAKVGMVVVFFGVAFLLRYAAERGLLPIEYRLMGTAAGAAALLAVGWRLRHSRPEYAVVLQGGAVGVLYLTIFAAFRLYALLPATLTFTLLLLVVAFSGLLAVTQQSMALAVIGTSGGFMAPILASTGSGSHVALFSYYAVLNAGVVGIAWFRSWRLLNWLAFVFTFGIGFTWGQQFYRPELFATTEPFLILFFLMFLTVAVIFAHRQPPQLRGYIDGSLVFGTPAIAFGMQSVLVRDIPFGRAYSAVALSALYLLLARTLWRRDATLRPLAEAFLALALVFLILAVPLAFTGHVTAAAWALEGTGLVWIGTRQDRKLARIVGTALLLGAGVAFAAMATPFSETPVLNTRFLGAVAIAAGSIVAARMVSLARDVLSRLERWFEWLLLVWGLLWWVGAATSEILDHLPADPTMPITLSVAVSGCLWALLARRWAWRALMLATIAIGPATWLLLLQVYSLRWHQGPHVDFGWLTWTVVIITNYGLLFWFEFAWPMRVVTAWHAATTWMSMFLATWLLGIVVSQLLPEASAWSSATWCLIPVVLVAGLQRFGSRLPWPVGHFPALYDVVIPAVPVVLTLLWVLWACTDAGRPSPLPYVPLLNPLELAQTFALLVAYNWATMSTSDIEVDARARSAIRLVAAGLAFLALNAVVARVVHFYLDVPFNLDDLLESSIFQTGISILWGLVASLLMALARVRLDRTIWMTGALLLGMLILKLFVVDLGQVGSVARIVSFLATGALILLIGYFAPVPPRAQRPDTEQTA
jgi:uncharacterized membrane protein